MERKCVQCGEVFTLTDSEVDFYNSKNLNLPKRCRNCRDFNKAANNVNRQKVDLNAPSQRKYKHGENTEYKSYYVSRPSTTKLSSVILLLLVAGLSLYLRAQIAIVVVSFIAFICSVIVYLATRRSNNIFIQEFDTALYKHTFYDNKSMIEHYIKHGQETACNSMEDYLCKANIVIADKGNKTKLQKKDGDQVYYNPKTKEFVVVAKAGYLRTYYIANDKYYNKQ